MLWKEVRHSCPGKVTELTAIDNKYKCESCGGRFVNAVKRYALSPSSPQRRFPLIRYRSCLKVLPDNLIFSLKRFEFDMTTLTRYKVNDEFTFPWTIDMTPYTIDYVNDPSAASEPDVFQLVGVVEHMGTAEAGHYISFIRTPPSASSTGETWARFDDMEVSEFEKEKLAEQCFGGTMPDNPQYNKWYNAYMLFYKRVPAVQAEDEANRAKSQAGPAQHPVPDSLGNEILATNQTLLREYCLLDPSLVMLIKGVTSDMRHKSNGQCSPDHRIERDMLEMILQQLYMVFSHGKDGKDFDAIARHLMKQADGCAMCHSILLDWITDNPSCTETLLLSCPVPLIRVAWAHLVYRLLESHRNLDPEGYGYGAEMSGSDESASDGGYPLSETSSLQRTVLMLKDLLRSLGQRQIKLWDSFFELWCLVADLGPIEKAVMLGEGLFTEALRILQMQPKVLPLNGQYVGLMDLGPVCSRWISSKRQFPATNLIRFIATIFEVVDICAEIVPDRGSRIPDIQLERFPITEPEAILIFDDFKKFLINMAERWDNANTSPLWPAEIVTQLTSCATEIETVDNVADTELATGRQIKADIKATIPEFFKPWFLHSFRTPIRMTEAFCLECSSPQEVQRVVADLADLLHRELTEEVGAPPMTAFNVLLDYDGDGAAAVLDFFDRMARNAILQKYSGAPEDCEELLKLVINTLPSWAPGLLVFSPKNVREASDRFLDSILFNNFPEAVSSALDVDELDEYDDALTSLDNARITTVRRLYEQCAIVVSVARKLTLPKRFVTNIDRVMGYCASWCEKILDDQSGIFLSMNANTAFDQRIRNDYQARVCRAIQDWDNEIEIDPMASGEDYISDLKPRSSNTNHERYRY